MEVSAGMDFPWVVFGLEFAVSCFEAGIESESVSVPTTPDGCRFGMTFAAKDFASEALSSLFSFSPGASSASDASFSSAIGSIFLMVWLGTAVFPTSSSLQAADASENIVTWEAIMFAVFSALLDAR